MSDPDVPADAGRPLEGGVLGKQAARDVATVAKGGAVQILGQLTHRGVGMAFTAVATRVLGGLGFGVFRIVHQILAIAGQLGLAGFNYASMRYIARARAHKEPGGVRGSTRIGLFGSGIASLVVVGILIAFAGPLADMFAGSRADLDEVAGFIRVGAAYVPLFAFMQVLRYCTQAYKTMVPSVLAGNVVQPVARFLLGMAAFAAGLEIAGAIATEAISMGIGALTAGILYRRMLSVEERSAPRLADRAGMVRFALPQAGASLLGVQTLGIGILVLGRYSSPFEAGAFAVALALQGPGNVFLGGIVNIWAPMVSDLYDRRALDRLGSLYKTITRWVATFSFPMFAVVMIMPEVFTSVMAPGRLAAAAAPVAAILAAGNLFYTGTGPTGYVISMTGRPTINLINSVVAVGLYVVLGAMVAEEHGAVGIAFVDAGVTAFVNAARVVEARVLIGVQPYGRSFLKPLSATSIGSLTLLGWKLIPGDAIAQEIAGIVVAALVYLVTLRLLGLDQEERYVLDRIVKRIPRRGRRPRRR